MAKFDPAKAAKWITANHKDKSAGICATYVRRALEAGGLDTTGHPVNARDYGPFLLGRGFEKIADATPSLSGDVVVIQPYLGADPAGHIAMYSGTGWVSDFAQRDFWGGPGFRTKQPAHQFLRWKPPAPAATVPETSTPVSTQAR